MKLQHLFACVVPIGLAIILSACGPQETSDEATAARTGLLKITATTGMIADTARIVGGDHVEVQGLMGPGVDPHLYKATQGDLTKLSGADIVLYNGLHLEGRMADILVKMARRVQTVQVTATIPEDILREPPEFLGQYDPHVWFDVSMWKYVAEHTRDTFIEADPANAEDYTANEAAFQKELDDLHVYAKEQIATVPKEGRILVTAHDAFGYFGRAYDIDVVGLQGISTASEAGLQDIQNILNIIIKRKARAVFVESSVSRKNVEALIEGAESRGHPLVLGGELFSDAMGAAGTPEGTYIGMVRHNVDTIVGALK